MIEAVRDMMRTLSFFLASCGECPLKGILPHHPTDRFWPAAASDNELAIAPTRAQMALDDRFCRYEFRRWPPF